MILRRRRGLIDGCAMRLYKSQRAHPGGVFRASCWPRLKGFGRIRQLHSTNIVRCRFRHFDKRLLLHLMKPWAPLSLLGPCLALAILTAAASGEDILIQASRLLQQAACQPYPPFAHQPGLRVPACKTAVPLSCCCAIQGGTVVNADRQFEADVLIRDGTILRVGPGLKVWCQQGAASCSVPGGHATPVAAPAGDGVMFQAPRGVAAPLGCTLPHPAAPLGSAGGAPRDPHPQRCRQAGDAGRHRPPHPPGHAIYGAGHL